MRVAFVRKTLQRLLNNGVLNRQHTILAVCAGGMDAEVFQSLNFENVTISNITPDANDDRVNPYAFELADLQKLQFEDQSFDFVFVSDGLHHCASPHLGLVEMLRVARIGVIAFEARDSFLMQIATVTNIVNPFECSAVMTSRDMSYGGLNNTQIPNYVYRWTEREFKKTVMTAQPYGRFRFYFAYGLHLTAGKYVIRKNTLSYWILKIGEPILRLLTFFFKKQKNSFAMIAIKPEFPKELWPWLEEKNGELLLSREYAKSHT